MADDDELGDAISALGTDATGTITTGPYEPTLVVKEASHESLPVLHSYQIKPSLQDKFKTLPVKEIVRNVLARYLVGKNYDVDSARKWTTGIANEINERVQELKMKRYKHIVQVVIGEMKGAGVKSGVRCVWDSETDSYTSETFFSDTVFCLVVVFGVYLY